MAKIEKSTYFPNTVSKMFKMENCYQYEVSKRIDIPII